MKYKNLHRGALLFALFLASLSAAVAQFTASGRVTDTNGDGLPGATVSLAGQLGVGTSADVDGNFRLAVPGNFARLSFSYTGYKTVVMEVSSGSPTVNVTLEEDFAGLDEVIVTGLATNVKRANAANAVSLISGRELTGTTVQQTVDGALYGKLTGATINANSGAPGGGISMKFRGITTLTGNSQPLFIIDGVYIDNSAIPNAANIVSGAYRDGRAFSDQDNPSNRLADIDPEDIERIEILKGASTAAIYGSRAGTGVVIITTKRGQTGAPTISLSQSVGFARPLRLLGVRQFDEAKVRTQYATAQDPNGDVQANLFLQAQANGKLYDYEDELYGNTGLLSTTRLSISGGSGDTKYFAGFTYKDEEGIVKNTGYDRLGFRLNLDQRLSKWFDVQLSSAFTRSNADRGYFNNDNTSTTNSIALSSTPPWAELHADEQGNYPNNPYAAANFLQTVDEMTNRESVNRVISGVTLTTHIMERENQSLRLIVRGGIDHYNLNTKVVFPRTLQFQKDGQGTNGFVAAGNTVNTNQNIGAFLVHNYVGSSLNFRTQLGMTGENFDQNTVIGTASFLIGSQTNLDQADSRNNVQRRIIQKDRGFFVQEEINWQDNVIVTLGMRGDKSTNNGDANKLFYYPRGSVALNLGHWFGFADPSDDNGLSLFKVRAAYGESGNFPANGAIYTPLNAVSIDGSTGSLITVTRGNDQLGPERQRELEAGFDIGLLSNRVTLEATVYNKTINDFLLRVAVPLSSGFGTSWANAGDLTNQGIELGIGIIPVSQRNLVWSNQFNFWLNRSEITKLNVPAFDEGGFAPILGVFRIEEGQSATQIVGSVPADEDNDGVKDGLTKLGDAEPDFNLSWAGNLSWNKLDFNWLWHWKQGGNNINLTTLLYDLGGQTWDYDETTLDPSGALTNGPYRISQLGANAEPFIENSGYIRLREVGLTYNIGRSLWDKMNLRVGVSGRNLLNFFDYNSYDPEVSNFGFRAISSNIEVNPFPSAKSFFFNVSATF
ncbi:MAG: SusC/RagA family TonB-linked outer membrane protein [Saprospiraceae bacterium]|nr:SusC/RagA family TonB-linked outer membrane protein [Saprospiraceae bacterium]